MGKKSNDELLKELIAAFESKLPAMIEEIIAEKLALDLHAFDRTETAGKDRQDFKTRSITK
jgi:hypothetical protein